MKLTVTIPKSDFNKIEQEKKLRGLTRSALIQKMIESFFARELEKKKISDYIAGYKKHPEKISEISARTAPQIKILEKF